MAEFDIAVLSRLRFRQLALAVALAETGNLHAAARAVSLSQPGATKTLKELEAALGAPLFDRQPKGMTPTPAGIEVVRFARLIISDAERMRTRAQQVQRGDVGVVRMGAIMAALPDLVADLLHEVVDKAPGVTVELTVATSDHLVQALHEGALDLAICRPVDGAGMQGLRFEPLLPEDLAVIAAADHPLRKARRLALADLTGQHWVLQPRPSPMRSAVELAFARAGLPAPRHRVETASMLTTTLLVERSQLLAVLPDSVAKYYAGHGMIAALPVGLSSAMGRYGLMLRDHAALEPAALRLVGLIRAGAGDTAAPADPPARRKP